MTIVPAERSHLRYVADNLRPADQQECWAAGGEDPYPGFAAATLVGLTWTLTGPSGNPCAVGGVTPTEDPRIGGVWMMGTEEIEDISRPFLRHSRGFLHVLHEYYPVLSNCVHSRNHVHIRWLEWLGFTVDREPITLPSGEAFFNFWRTYNVLPSAKRVCTCQKQVSDLRSIRRSGCGAG